MKYKIGDKAKVREDLEVGKKYGKQVYVKDMDNLKGSTVTIKNIDEDKHNHWHFGYRIEELGYTWTDEMLEDFKEEVMIKISKWDDLNGKENTDFVLSTYDIDIYGKAITVVEIRQKVDNTYIGQVRAYPIHNNRLISWLNLIGFKVEFDETERILRKKDCEFLNFFPNDCNKNIERFEENLLGLGYDKTTMDIDSNLFQCIKKGEKFTFVELRKWKVEVE
jgi:hypothetical protein